MVKRVFEKNSGPAAPSLSAHVLLLRGGKVLLARRSPDAAYAPGLWHAGAAGKVDPGEDVVSAAVRECGEELGVRVEPPDLEFAHVVHSQEGAEWVHFFFVCRRWDGAVANREPHKHTEVAWFPAHRLPEGTVGYCAQALAHALTGERFSQHRTRTPFPARRPAGAEEAVLGDAGVAGSLALLLEGVAEERRRQQTLFGVQRLSPGTGPEHGEQAGRARARVDRAGAAPTWWDLAFEELCEARAAATDEELRTELVQTCAVLVQWAQSTLRPSGGTGA
ncbi:NUDIX domain-containing protein [Nocardiopsis sp. NPDC006198]|uniref:NUDIX hydrolase n=1 Tax=Nocardiopsis sp. NPDC006198 TaxID=3154472 RepID=UPI0033AC34F1